MGKHEFIDRFIIAKITKWHRIRLKLPGQESNMLTP